MATHSHPTSETNSNEGTGGAAHLFKNPLLLQKEEEKVKESLPFQPNLHQFNQYMLHVTQLCFSRCQIQIQTKHLTQQQLKCIQFCAQKHNFIYLHFLQLFQKYSNQIL